MPGFQRKYPFQKPDDDGGSGGGGGGGTPPANPPKPEPEVFSREYVKELRHESASYRTKAQENERKAQEAEDRAKKAAEESEAKIKEATTAAEARIIRAELKAAALKAGMVDLDGLKLADLSKVKLGENGEVEGADALMEELKKAKPYLFGSASTSNPGNPPPKDPPTNKKATEMTAEEYAKAKAEALKKAGGR